MPTPIQVVTSDTYAASGDTGYFAVTSGGISPRGMHSRGELKLATIAFGLSVSHVDFFSGSQTPSTIPKSWAVLSSPILDYSKL